VLSRRSNFISKEDQKKKLFKEVRDSLKYSSKVVVVYKIIKDCATKQQIQEVYKRDAKAKMAKA
jgi:hypothetical protein